MDDLMQDICPRFEDEDLPWDLSDHDDDVPLPSPSPVPRRDASFHDGETLAPQSETPAPRSRTPPISAHNAPYERERHTATEQSIHGGHINMRRPSRWDSQPSHDRPSTSRNPLSERKGPFKHKPNYPPHHHARKFQQYSHRQPDDLGRLLNSVQAYQATLDRHGCLIEEQDRTIKEMNGKLDALTEHTYTQSKLINTQHELLNKVFSHIEILSQRPSPPERQSYDRPTFYLSGPFYPNDGPRYFGGTSSERHDVEPLWHPAFFVEDDQVQERKRPDDRGTINHVPSDRPPHHRNPSGHRRPPLYERISSGDSPLEPRSGRHGRQNGGGYQSKDTPRGTASKRAHPSHAPSPFRQAGSLPPAYSEVPPDAPSLLQRVEPRIPSLKRKYSSYSREEDRIWQPAASWTRRHSNQSPRTFPMPEPPVSLSARIGEYVR